MEKTLLHIYFEEADRENAELLLSSLTKEGYQAKLTKEGPRQEDFCIVILSPKTDQGRLLKDLPWLKDQFDYSSFHLFRLMPVLVYEGEKNLDAVWEDGVGEIYENVFSGEFKPFGFDIKSENPLKEFPRILEEYI